MVIGLQTRLIASLTILVCVTLTLMGFVLLQDANSRLELFHLTQAKHQAKTLAEGSLDALVTQDFELLERWVASAMPSKEYAFAALVKPNGIVLTHTKMDLIGHKVYTLKDLHSYKVRKTKIDNRPVIEVIYPAFVGNRHLANAHVSYYTDIERGVAEESLPWISLAVIFSLVVITLGSFLLSKKITNPIKYLTKIVSDFTPEKELSIEASISERSDEVGALARTFNNMSTRLFDAYRQLTLKSEELERRVKERTRELVESNQDLKESETRIAAIVDNIADGVITVDNAGIIESCNLAALQIFGYDNSELIGLNYSTLFPSYKKVSNYTCQSNSQPLETIATTKYGMDFTIEYSVRNIYVHNRTISIFVFRDISERKATLEHLIHIANHDTLTGLYNRSFLLEELERTVARTKREDSKPCAILYIDLDNFKYVNDTFGHAAGDRVLIDVTQIMKSRARESDILCRLGGDEFVALIFDTSPELAAKIAEAFRQKLANYVYQNGNEKVDVGCSIGISIITKDCKSADEELENADYACYQAKRSGRNCVRMFDPEDKHHSARTPIKTY